MAWMMVDYFSDARPTTAATSIQPLDRRYRAARGLDAGDHLLRALDRRHHVMRIGVNDGGGIARDCDMPLPENQIAALEIFDVLRIEFAAEPVLLHVAVARTTCPRRGQRDLNQPRAIDSNGAFAAPQIGRADELLGDSNEIRRTAIERANMLPRQIPAFARHGE